MRSAPIWTPAACLMTFAAEQVKGEPLEEGLRPSRQLRGRIGGLLWPIVFR